MRVISGTAKGQRLLAPEGLDTRPTADRMKEALFNVISFDIMGCRFLDLFSGSGAIGIEALSRGAESAVFLECSSESASVIRKNLGSELSKRACVYCCDISELSKRTENSKFDIIFMDPPYNSDCIRLALEQIKTGDLLYTGGYIIAEQGSKDSVPQVSGFQVYKQKIYKTTKFVFLESCYDSCLPG